MTSQPRRTLSQSLEALLCAATVPSTRTVAVGSLLATVSSLAPGCDPAAPVVDSLEQGVIAYGQADWVQRSGIRDTAQVQYYKEYWRDLSTCNSRFGCRSITVFINRWYFSELVLVFSCITISMRPLSDVTGARRSWEME